MCDAGEIPKNCDNHNVFVYSIWRLARAIDPWSVLITAIGTVAIAGFTLTLWQSSEKMWKLTRVSTVSARRAAKAAKISADAAYAAERARFFIVIEKHNLEEIIDNLDKRGSLAAGENISIKYHFRNYGKTPGILKEVVIDSVLASELPESLPLMLSTKDFPEFMIGGGTSTKSKDYSPATPPRGPQVAAVGRNNIRFWLYGRLYYDDVFGGHQVHCFYFRSQRKPGETCALELVEPKNHKRST